LSNTNKGAVGLILALELASLTVRVMAMNSSASKSWNNGDKLLKKFIGGSLDDGIEMGMKTWSGYEGPRLSMEAQRRLEFVEELSE